MTEDTDKSTKHTGAILLRIAVCLHYWMTLYKHTIKRSNNAYTGFQSNDIFHSFLCRSLQKLVFSYFDQYKDQSFL